MIKKKQEIIKALELCCDDDAPCIECPYRNKDEGCMKALLKDAAMQLRNMPNILTEKKVEETL